MTPSKRRTRGGRPVHHGRVTNREDDTQPPRGLGIHPDELGIDAHQSARSTKRASSSSDLTASRPARTGRTTVPQRSIRFRPQWHKVVGCGLLLVGLALGAVNDVMLLQPSLELLPGGHNELYLFAGLAAAGYSTWFFGWYDRTR